LNLFFIYQYDVDFQLIELCIYEIDFFIAIFKSSAIVHNLIKEKKMTFKNVRNIIMVLSSGICISFGSDQDFANDQNCENLQMQTEYNLTDENYLVDMGISRDIAKIIAREAVKSLTLLSVEGVRLLNPHAADVSKIVCIDCGIADRSTTFMVDKTYDSCNSFKKWWGK